MKNRMFAALALSMSAGIGDVFEITKRPEPPPIVSFIGGYDNSYGRTKEDVMKLDLRVRCQRCNKIPRGKMQLENYARYKPYCSFHCQEWGNLENAQRYINSKNYMLVDPCE